MHQGWEHANHLLKVFFLTRTQRGGSVGGDSARSSRVAPLGRWLKRRMMFLLNLVSDIIFEDVSRGKTPSRFRWSRTPFAR